MERKLFLILTGLALLVAGLVWRVGGPGETSGPVPLAFPQLAGQLTDVAKLVVTDAAVETTLVRKGDGWISETFGGYPADTATVRQFLYGVTKLQRLEPKTTNASLFARLGLAPVEETGSRAVRVRLVDTQGKVIADYLQGDIAAETGGQSDGTRFYFVETGGTQAWLVGGGQQAVADPAQWIGKDLVNIDQERVKELTILPPTGQVMTVYRDTPFETAFKIKGIKGTDADKDKAAQPMADALGGLFSFVRFAAVQPRDRVSLEGKPYRVKLVTFDGLAISLAQYEGTARAGSAKPQSWAVFSAETVPVTDEPADWQKQLQDGERELPLKTRELVEAEARAINDLGKAWVVRLQDFKADRLRSAPGMLGTGAPRRP